MDGSHGDIEHRKQRTLWSHQKLRELKLPGRGWGGEQLICVSLLLAEGGRAALHCSKAFPSFSLHRGRSESVGGK